MAILEPTKQANTLSIMQQIQETPKVRPPIPVHTFPEHPTVLDEMKRIYDQYITKENVIGPNLSQGDYDPMRGIAGMTEDYNAALTGYRQTSEGLEREPGTFRALTLLSPGTGGAPAEAAGAGILRRTASGRPLTRTPIRKETWLDQVIKNIKTTKQEEIAKKYIYKPIEGSVKGKTFYHGSRAPIKNLGDVDVIQFGDPAALYGPGLYLTDNPKIAAGYAKTKGKGGHPGRVHSVSLKHANLINLDQLPDKRVYSEIKGFLDEFEELDDEVLKTKPVKWLYSRLKEDMRNEMYDMGDASDLLFDLQGRLGKLGYDGFTHQGGQISGGDVHNVVILWDKTAWDSKAQRVVNPITDYFEEY